VKFALASFLTLGIIIGAVADRYLPLAALLHGRLTDPAVLEVSRNHIEARANFFQQSQSEAAVVMLGDSITEYGGDWTELLGTPALNRGIAWDTVDGILVRLNEVIEKKPKIVAVMAGINDVRAGVPVDLVASRIEQILTKLKAADVQPVMQSTLLTGTELGEPATNKAIIALNRALSQWCAGQNVPFLDLNASLAPQGLLDPSITIDGIHLTDAGYLRWRDVLDPLLRRMLDS
jgi:lysophospholipase L1-like esterase